VAIALDYLRRQKSQIESSRPPLNFRLEVPTALYHGYLNQLQPTDFLRGPARDWQFYRGRWGDGYEEIDVLDPLESSFALWSPRTFADATIEAQIRLDPASDSAALVFRANPAGSSFRGYDLTLDAKQSSVVLRAHGSGKPRLIAQTRYNVRSAHWHKIKLVAEGPFVRVWLDGAEQPLIVAEDKTPVTAPGRLGFRVWGSSIDVKELWLEAGQTRTRIDDPQPPAPETVAREALASLCLVILNLNEVIYVK
jgi:hypothetical protein